jgi:hypothetical protein
VHWTKKKKIETPRQVADPSMPNRRLLLVGTIVIAVVAGWFSCHVRSARIETGFYGISNGDSEQQVRAVMGRPSRVGKCGQVTPFGYPPRCSKEYVYNDPFLQPQSNVVWFDENGQLIGKDYYSSP